MTRARALFARWLLTCTVLVWASQSRWSLLLLSETGAVGDVTQQHGTAGAFTITLASLGTSSTWVAGRESTALTISALTPANALDLQIAAKITVGTSPTAGTQIQVWAYATMADGTTYPDTLTGSDAAATLTSAGIRNSAVVLLGIMEVDATTSNRAYFMRPTSVRRAFGFLPAKVGVWVTHNTGVNLNATGGNHFINYRPIYENVAAS
ncbi:MAG: hypothetical protein AB7R67_20275 [Vicinamibacterales bacterium]